MTSRQRSILLFVNNRIAETGVSPSAAEIGAEVGISRVNTSNHLRALMAAGFLRRVGNRRGVRSLEVLQLPGSGLRAEEIAWCHANPDRVRALIAVVGQPPGSTVAAQPPALLDPGPAGDAAIAAGRRAISTLAPGEAAEIALPLDPVGRERAYRRISVAAIRA